MVDYAAMGRRMKMKRRARKLSQEELARAVQISTSFYGNIERGIRVPSIDTLAAIANVLNTGTDFLLADSLTAPHIQRSENEIRVLARYLRDQIEELDYGSARQDD